MKGRWKESFGVPRREEGGFGFGPFDFGPFDTYVPVEPVEPVVAHSSKWRFAGVMTAKSVTGYAFLVLYIRTTTERVNL